MKEEEEEEEHLPEREGQRAPRSEFIHIKMASTTATRARKRKDMSHVVFCCLEEYKYILFIVEFDMLWQQQFAV